MPDISDERKAEILIDQWNEPRPSMNGAHVTITHKVDYKRLNALQAQLNERSHKTPEQIVRECTDQNMAWVVMDGNIWPAIEIPWSMVDEIMRTTRVFRLNRR